MQGGGCFQVIYFIPKLQGEARSHPSHLLQPPPPQLAPSFVRRHTKDKGPRPVWPSAPSRLEALKETAPPPCGPGAVGCGYATGRSQGTTPGPTHSSSPSPKVKNLLPSVMGCKGATWPGIGGVIREPGSQGPAPPLMQPEEAQKQAARIGSLTSLRPPASLARAQVSRECSPAILTDELLLLAHREGTTAPCLLLRDASQGTGCLSASPSPQPGTFILCALPDEGSGAFLAPCRSLPEACLPRLGAERLLGPQIPRKACYGPVRAEQLIDLPPSSQTQTCLIACVIVFPAVFLEPSIQQALSIC